MRGHRIMLFRLEISFAVLTGILGVVTVLCHDWIEVLTGWSPDHHSGSVEFGLIPVLLITGVSCAAAARRTYRRLATS